MDSNDQAAILLLAEIQRLTAADPTTDGAAARITIRSANGEYIGETPLTPSATKALTNAISVVADCAENHPNDFLAGGRAPSAVAIDSGLEAEFEEYCIGLPVDDLVAKAAQDPAAAVAAFDELVEGGEL